MCFLPGASTQLCYVGAADMVGRVDQPVICKPCSGNETSAWIGCRGVSNCNALDTVVLGTQMWWSLSIHAPFLEVQQP